MCVGAFCALAALGLGRLAQMERIENILYDWRVKTLNKPVNINPKIKQILIDQKSLEWMSSQNGLGWPWPREIYAHIVSFLKEGGAKVVVFDMIFTEPSVYGVEDDKRFAEALSSIKSVGAVVVRSENNETLSSTPEIDKAFFTKGNVAAAIDEDGVIRRVRLFQNSVPTLSMAAHKALYAAAPTASEKLKIINFRGKVFSFDSYNAAEVIASKVSMDEGKKPKLNPNIFKDSVVFVGLSADGLHDLKPTPMGGDFLGVEIHSNILDNIQKNDFVAEAGIGVLAFWTLAFAVFAAFVVYKVERLSLLVAFYILLPTVAFLLCALYHGYGVWLGSATILLGFFLSLILSSILKYIVEGRQKSYIKSAFGKYISPLVVEELIKHPESLQLGGEERKLSIFFSDIAGFTTISEKLPPTELVSLLNRYLDKLSKIILSQSGTIDKYEGDAIIAFWNAPALQENHASLALTAAMECQNAVRELNKELANSIGVALNTRIGINTGSVIVGNIGSSLRFDYSFIGDAGNFASRLEGANKFFATKILISEYTKEALEGDFGVREVGKIKVVGKTKPVRVFEPCGYLDEDKKRSFAQGLEAFYAQDLDTASATFGSLADVDAVAKRYLKIIEELKSGEIVWDDGLLLTSK